MIKRVLGWVVSNMGFLKNILIEKGFNKKLAKKVIELKFNSNCRKCDSKRLKYTKHMGYGEKMGLVYHYKAHCLDCKKSYHVKRVKEVYDAVKEQNWMKSKSYWRHYNAGTLINKSI